MVWWLALSFAVGVIAGGVGLYSVWMYLLNVDPAETIAFEAGYDEGRKSVCCAYQEAD